MDASAELMITPTNINNLAEEGSLEVVWPDALTARLPFRDLRNACNCAHCVHELTGQKLVRLTDIPTDIHIAKMDLVGAYALRIKWSDGHDTGLFTWDRLRELSEQW